MRDFHRTVWCWASMDGRFCQIDDDLDFGAGAWYSWSAGHAKLNVFLIQRLVSGRKAHDPRRHDKKSHTWERKVIDSVLARTDQHKNDKKRQKNRWFMSRRWWNVQSGAKADGWRDFYHPSGTLLMTHQWNILLDVVFNENLQREINLKQKNKSLLTTGLTENPIADPKSSSSDLVEVVSTAV